MSLTCLICCCLNATPGALAAVAQPQPTPENAPRVPAAARRPMPSETMAMYRLVDGWVREWEVPAQPDLKGILGAHAAMVVLRLNGEIVGRGSDHAEAPSPDVLVTAAQIAIAEADRRLPLENDALREEAVQRLARDMTISLELAGGLIPLAARTYDEATRELSPGVDGVAARVGTRTAWVFPSTILMQSLSTRMALSSAAAQAADNAALGLAEMDKLITDHGVKFYRFRVSHIAQGAAGAAPTFLYRGSRLVNLAEITSDEILASADRIAEHILARAWSGTEPYGMSGSYDPCRDASEPSVAPPIEQLTACLALVRYARLLEPGSARATQLLTFVDRVVLDLAKIAEGEVDASMDPVASAAWVLLVGERGVKIAPAAFDAQCRRTLLGAFRMDEGFSPNVPPAAHALIALALVRLADEEQAGKLKQEAIMLADAANRRVLSDASAGGLVGRMPWLGWAEIELARVKGEKQLGSATAFRQMRTLVWDHQVSGAGHEASDAQGGGPDMVGGIVFDSGARAGVVLPTWQTARPIAFIATMLADERLTRADERPLELARLIGSLRFLRQLQMDDASAWMCQNPRRALGGIRAAPWDQRMPTDASAITLLALSEAARALRTLQP